MQEVDFLATLIPQMWMVMIIDDWILTLPKMMTSKFQFLIRKTANSPSALLWTALVFLYLVLPKLPTMWTVSISETNLMIIENGDIVNPSFVVFFSS